MKKPVVKVYHSKGGSWVDSPCSCHGYQPRVHSMPVEQCPFHRYRSKYGAQVKFEQIDIDEAEIVVCTKKKVWRERR